MPSTDTDWTTPDADDLEARLLAAFNAAADRAPSEVPPCAMKAAHSDQARRRPDVRGAAAVDELQPGVAWGVTRRRGWTRRGLGSNSSSRLDST